MLYKYGYISDNNNIDYKNIIDIISKYLILDTHEKLLYFTLLDISNVTTRKHKHILSNIQISKNIYSNIFEYIKLNKRKHLINSLVFGNEIYNSINESIINIKTITDNMNYDNQMIMDHIKKYEDKINNRYNIFSNKDYNCLPRFKKFYKYISTPEDKRKLILKKVDYKYIFIMNDHVNTRLNNIHNFDIYFDLQTDSGKKILQYLYLSCNNLHPACSIIKLLYEYHNKELYKNIHYYFIQNIIHSFDFDKSSTLMPFYIPLFINEYFAINNIVLVKNINIYTVDYGLLLNITM